MMPDQHGAIGHAVASRHLGRLGVLVACSLVFLGPALVNGQAAPTSAPLVRSWEYRTPDQAYTVRHDARGLPFLYVTARARGLLVLDVADPAKPRLVRTVPGSSFGGRYTNNLHQVGDRLYVATGNFTALPSQRPGVAIVDVSDPATAAVVGRWEHSTGSRGAHVVEVRGSHAFLGASFEGLIILDIANPKAIRLVSRFLPDIHFPTRNPGAFQRPAARGLAVVNDSLLLLAYDAGGLRSIDIRDKTNPSEVGRYVNSAINPRVQAQAYNNVVAHGSTAYVTVDYCGVEALDISDAGNPRQLAWWNPWRCVGSALNWMSSPGHASELVLRADEQRLFVSAGDTELAILDVTVPTALREVATYGRRSDNRVAWGVDVTATHVYLAHIMSPGGPFRSNWAGVVALARR
jgi:hypothetical protein